MTLQEKMRKKAAKLTNPTPVELPSGAWRCQVMCQGRRLSTVDADPEIAHAKILALKNGLIKETKAPSHMTVGDAIKLYIESKDTVLSPSTIRSYKSLRDHAYTSLNETPLRFLAQESVQRWANTIAKNHTPKYVANAHGLLSAAVSMYRPDFVLRTTLPKKEKKEINIPTMEEILVLAENAKGSEFELPFLLAVWMGLRTSEIRGLTWDCVNGNILHIKQALVEGEDGAVMKGTKSYSSNRKLRIPPYIQTLIEQQPRRDEFIIHYSRNALYNRLRRMCERYGLPHYRFHDLRHVQASALLALNVPDKYSMERMGHSSNHILKHYQHTWTSKTEEYTDSLDAFFGEKLHINLHTKKELP